MKADRLSNMILNAVVSAVVAIVFGYFTGSPAWGTAILYFVVYGTNEMRSRMSELNARLEDAVDTDDLYDIDEPPLTPAQLARLNAVMADENFWRKTPE